ncbi:MAG: hypothetical protein KC464_24915, partial [Myxococcales bacterium]|nr:hypothetical protein [Myxococcales bacterium]
GGAQRPPPEPGTPGVLTCTSDGKRMDGCPAVEPRDAGACADVGQQCTYGDPCGYTQRGYTCGAGGWAMTSDLTRPPPP